MEMPPADRWRIKIRMASKNTETQENEKSRDASCIAHTQATRLFPLTKQVAVFQA
jgi:hypothetical protein